MPLITWSNQYSVHVDEFDGHHKKLVGYVNELNEAMRQGKGKDAIPGLLTKLISYTQTHFAQEEEAMKKYGYPELAAHKEEHTKLLKKVQDFKKDFDSGKLSVTIELMNFLQSWLLDHIQKVDKRYGAHFNEKGIR